MSILSLNDVIKSKKAVGRPQDMVDVSKLRDVQLGEEVIVVMPKYSCVAKAGIPIITTSANKNGQKFMTSLQNLEKEIEQEVEFIIYEGPKEAHPSKIMNVVEGWMKER